MVKKENTEEQNIGNSTVVDIPHQEEKLKHAEDIEIKDPLEPPVKAFDMFTVFKIFGLEWLSILVGLFTSGCVGAVPIMFYFILGDLIDSLTPTPDGKGGYNIPTEDMMRRKINELAMWFVMISTSPLIGILIGGAGKLTQVLTKKTSDASEHASGTATEVISCIRTVRSMAGEEYEKARFAKDLTKITLFGLFKSLTQGFMFGGLFFCIWGTCALAFWYGGGLVADMELSIGGLMQVFGQMLIAVLGLGQATAVLPDLAKARVAAGSLLKTPKVLLSEGELEGHYDTVTSLCVHSTNPNILISGSKDKSILIWEITKDKKNKIVNAEVKKTFTGHEDLISDLFVSHSGEYLFSSSFDKTLKLWDLETGEIYRNFPESDSEKNAHKDVITSFSVSLDDRMIVSSSKDKTLKLWNTLGICKYTIDDINCSTSYHNDCVSCVKMTQSQLMDDIRMISAGDDKIIKVWILQHCKLEKELLFHKAKVNTLDIYPDNTLLASGDDNGQVALWLLNSYERYFNISFNEKVIRVAFNPKRSLLAILTSNSIKLLDFASKSIVDEVTLEEKRGNEKVECTSIVWSTDGLMLFAGCGDTIRAWRTKV
ncbi:hypothetical protein ABK040_011945 [Willaertia magna]